METRQLEEEEGLITRWRLVKEVDQGSIINGGLVEEEEEEEEEEVWPVEHPMEPKDEDRPVFCPIPTSSLLPLHEGERSDQKRNVESWRKRAENTTINKYTAAERFEVAEADHRIGVARKRHHTHSNQREDRDHDHRNLPADAGLRRMTTLSLPSNNNVANTIFHMLQPAAP